MKLLKNLKYSLEKTLKNKFGCFGCCGLNKSTELMSVIQIYKDKRNFHINIL